MRNFGALCCVFGHKPGADHRMATVIHQLRGMLLSISNMLNSVWHVVAMADQ